MEGFGGRPRGRVEVFLVDQGKGLAPVGRFGLGLFATVPERLAVSPGGRWLGVGLAGGGYNLLPLGEDGLPGRVMASVRRIGRGQMMGRRSLRGRELLVSRGSGGVTALSVGADGIAAVCGW